MALAALVVVGVLGLAACGSSGTKAAVGPTTSGSSGGGSYAQDITVAQTGLVTPLPSTPVKVTKGENLWVVSCGQMVETCSSPAAGAVAAAKVLGWTTHICDGMLNPASVSGCVRQAVAAKATVIDVVGFDCSSIRQSLVEANAAGIKTVAGGGFDCAETGGTQVYSGTMKDAAALTNHQWWAELGKLQADWIIGATDGKAKVLSIDFTDESWGASIENAFTQEIATCSGCSVLKTLDVGNADIESGTVLSKISTGLLQEPTANALNEPVDGVFTQGLAQAITSSGRSSKLAVIGALGGTPNMGYIRSGTGEDATAAFSGAQTGWASIDVALRLLAGQTAPGGQFPEGIGIRVVDKTANLPPAGQPYNPGVDYVSAYEKLWGVG